MPRDRPRLWESFKRVLGNSSRQSGIDRDDESPPFLAPEEALPSAPHADSAPVEARSGAIESRGEDAAPERVAEAVKADQGTESAAESLSPPGVPAGRPPRLARGLASFSRDNADREKKYRHILSDGDSGTKKR